MTDARARSRFFGREFECHCLCGAVAKAWVEAFLPSQIMSAWRAFASRQVVNDDGWQITACPRLHALRELGLFLGSSLTSDFGHLAIIHHGLKGSCHNQAAGHVQITKQGVHTDAQGGTAALELNPI